MTDSAHFPKKKLTANVKSAGCAAKISSTELAAILKSLPTTSSEDLIAGMDNFEDAAVYKITEDLAIVQTIDFFPPVVDDPYLFGQIAATNALSDVYAMGARPILALNVLCFPTCDYPLEVVQEIVRGGADQVALSGAVLGGGHSIQLAEPVYGLSVTGLVHPAKVLTNSGAREGDKLVLSKPIGSGVALLALKGNELSKSAQKVLFTNLTMLNCKALEISKNFAIHSATDVTGFGLLGHVHEMALASGFSARITTGTLAQYPEVKDLADQGFVPAGAYGNRTAYEQFVSYINDVDLAFCDLLFDPQTSGGLLLSVPAAQASSLLAQLKAEGMAASIVGEIISGSKGMVEVI